LHTHDAAAAVRFSDADKTGVALITLVVTLLSSMTNSTQVLLLPLFFVFPMIFLGKVNLSVTTTMMMMMTIMGLGDVDDVDDDNDGGFIWMLGLDDAKVFSNSVNQNRSS